MKHLIPLVIATGVSLTTVSLAEPHYELCSAIHGAHIRTSDSDDVGTIQDLLIDPHDGRIVTIVTSVNDRLIPVPWTAVKVSEDTRVITVRTTRERLITAPTIERAEITTFSPERFQRSDTFFRENVTNVNQETNTTNTTNINRENSTTNANRENNAANVEAQRKMENKTSTAEASPAETNATRARAMHSPAAVTEGSASAASPTGGGGHKRHKGEANASTPASPAESTTEHAGGTPTEGKIHSRHKAEGANSSSAEESSSGSTQKMESNPSTTLEKPEPKAMGTPHSRHLKTEKSAGVESNSEVPTEKIPAQ